ncbi:MAG: hypothetical protein JW700_02325 [Candidatus Aenigmarchaeota archaeon]|nr:hypothetical protein [Candidatus Aenigmarchaeota archaeon]
MSQVIQVETGQNWEKRKEYENTIDGVRLDGYPNGLAQALWKMDKLPERIIKVDTKGDFDNILKSLQSEDYVTQRKNIAQQNVPARWYEYMDDRKDSVAALFDYLTLIINPVYRYRNGLSDAKDNAKGIINGIKQKYPIGFELMKEYEDYEEAKRNGVKIKPTEKITEQKKPLKPTKATTKRSKSSFAKGITDGFYYKKNSDNFVYCDFSNKGYEKVEAQKSHMKDLEMTKLSNIQTQTEFRKYMEQIRSSLKSADIELYKFKSRAVANTGPNVNFSDKYSASKNNNGRNSQKHRF